MARRTGVAKTENGNVTGTTQVLDLPAHVAGTLLMVFIAVRTRTISSVNGSWVQHRAVTSGVSGYIYKLVASSDAETLTITLNSTGAAVAAVAYTLEGHNLTGWSTSNSAQVTFGSVASKEVASPTLPSVAAGSLILHACMIDSTSGVFPPNDVLDTYSAAAVATCRVGEAVSVTGGALTSFNWRIGANNRSGLLFVVEIPNAAGAPTGVSVLNNALEMCFSMNNLGASVTTDAPDLGGVIPTIDGIATAVAVTSLTSGAPDANWVGGGGFPTATPASTMWMGGYIVLPTPVDLTDAVFPFNLAYNSIWGTSRVATPGGSIMVFIDGTNRWAAFRLHTAVEGAPSASYQFVWPVASMTPLDYSYTTPGVPSIDFSDIRRVGALVARPAGTAATLTTYLAPLCYMNAPFVFRGFGITPIKATTCYDYINSRNRGFGYSSFQGIGQLVLMTSIQFGDGSVPTEVEFGGSSVEFASYDAKYRPYIPNQLDVIVHASASDAMDFSSSIFATDVAQNFTIHAGSHLSASYNFDGCTLLGFAVTWKTGVPCVGVKFRDGAPVQFKGADVSRARISGTTAGATEAASVWDASGAVVADTTIDLTGTAAGYHAELGADVAAITFNNNTLQGAPGTNKIFSRLATGVLTITWDGNGTALANSDVTFIGGSTATANVVAPAVERGLEFTGLVAGSFVRVVKDLDGSQLFVDTNSATSETWDDATAGSLAVSYVIQKAGYEPIGPISVTVTGAVGTGIQSIPVNQVPARWYQASSGLTINANAFANATTKKFGLTTTSTLQNFASYLLEQWIVLGGTGGAFANKPWPLSSNGPNSFSWLDGWEADLTTYPNTISLLSRDGMRYLNTGGTATAIWAALLSNGVPAGKQVRYQQQDGIGTTNALTTGNIDQLIQIYGDTTHGNYDKRNWLVLKVQTLGDYDQAEADAVVTYGTLEDQLYVVGLAPTPNGVAAQAGITGITITSEPTPVLWNGQLFSVTITDTTDAHSGLQIMQYVRGLNEFNWHDMIRPSGSKFVTVNGSVYGDTLPTPAGVRVVKADGVTPHSDFSAFAADNGATYVPPVAAPISWAGALDGTTVLLYNDSAAGAIIDTQTISGAGGYSLAVSLPSGIVAAGDSLRLRYGNKAYYAGELQGTMTTSGLAFVGSMVTHPIYAAWGLNGSTYDQAFAGPFAMDGTNLQVDIAAGATTGLKTQLGAWTQHLMTLPAGLAAFYGAWDLLAVNQIRQNVSVVDVKIDVPTAGALFTFTDHDVNYYRSDFSYPGNVQTGHGLVAITYNASIFVPDPVVISGQSVVTGTAASIIAAIPSAADNAAAIAAKTMGARTLGQHIQAQSAALLGATAGAGTSHLTFTDGAAVVEADVPLPGVAGDRSNVVISGV